MCSAQSNGPETAGANAVARVAAVLAAYGPGDRSLGVTELARRTGLPKSTVHRLTGQLADHGLLERDDEDAGRGTAGGENGRQRGGGLRLGLRLFSLGELASRQRDLRDVALPHMADLREATRQTVQLAVLEGTEVVYVQILQTRDAPRLPSRIGGRLPAYATGVGKAMLAFAPEEVTDAVLATGLPPIGPRTTTSPRLLRRELARIREAGVAFDHEESATGLVCAASPVLSGDGHAVASLSISGWSGRLNLRRVAPAVRTAGLALARELQARREDPSFG